MNNFTSMTFHHCCFCSVAKFCPTLCDPRDCRTPGSPAHHYLPVFAQTWWCHSTTSHPLLPPSPPASGPFPASLLFTSGQSIGVSASILPVSVQGWLTGWISLQSKWLSRVFSSTAVWKHPFFRVEPSLWSNSQIYTWLWKNYSFGYTDGLLSTRWCLFLLLRQFSSSNHVRSLCYLVFVAQWRECFRHCLLPRPGRCVDSWGICKRVIVTLSQLASQDDFLAQIGFCERGMSFSNMCCIIGIS